MKNFTRHACLISLSGLLAFSAFKGSAQQNTDYSEAIRELDIMSNIFEAALEPRRANNNFSPTSFLDESSYLADQGMVFSFVQPGQHGMMAFVDFNGIPGAGFTEMEINMEEMAREIRTEVRRMLPAGDFTFPGGPFASIAMMEEEMEALEEMSEAVRDQQEVIRDLQRDMRDLQRELREADDDNAEIQENIVQLQSQIDAERDELQSLASNYQGVMQEFQQQRSNEIAEQNETARSLIFSTLCDYGNTLDALQNDEHVTVIMQNYENGRDQVYVLNYADVASCSSAEQLLENAIAYQI
jgi:uncharacterized coiled-coil protein SlyX